MQGCGRRGYFRGQLGNLIFNARGWADGEVYRETCFGLSFYEIFFLVFFLRRQTLLGIF